MYRSVLPYKDFMAIGKTKSPGRHGAVLFLTDDITILSLFVIKFSFTLYIH